jgi:hypothetical protein
VLVQGKPDAAPRPLLLTGEGVASYALALTPEAVAAGLTLHDSAPYPITLTGNQLKLWLEVAPDMRGSPIFDGAGVIVGIELTITTTATPPRRKQRTALVRISNQ